MGWRPSGTYWHQISCATNEDSLHLTTTIWLLPAIVPSYLELRMATKGVLKRHWLDQLVVTGKAVIARLSLQRKSLARQPVWHGQRTGVKKGDKLEGGCCCSK